MIKLIIFDLDGVLVEARDLHYHALNRALSSIDQKYVISREEHLSTYDGLPTRKKLEMLSETKGLPVSEHATVWARKQYQTTNVIAEMVKPDVNIMALLSSLKISGYRIFCASNSIRSTIETMLHYSGLEDYVDFIISNEEVMKPKPHPEIYMKAMLYAGVSPKETLVVEDSHIGRQAAYESGAHVLGITGTHELSNQLVFDTLDRLNSTEKFKPKWQGRDMNVLIPMAGAGSRFEKAGYTFPKPLIEVNGKPMIQLVVENLNIDARHIFIVQKSHYDKYNLKHLLRLIAPGCEIVQVDGMTEGAACTTLLAKEFINNDNPLVIANSDQYVEWNSNEFLYAMSAPEVDAGILTFESVHPKWSFARLGNHGEVVEVAEKKPISTHATVGIYYWKKGSDYVHCAEKMIDADKRVNGEFYVCPVFNEIIEEQGLVRTYPIDKMWGLGTPEDLEVFLKEYNGARPQ